LADLEDFARAAARGDRVAFTELVRYTTPTVYRLALRMLGSESEAADVLQDTYIRSWQKIESLRDPTVALGWICRICRNLCTDQLRVRKRQPSAPASEEVIEFFDPEMLAQSSEASDAIWRLVQTLRDKHRIVLLLHVVEGMSNEEISVVLGCPIGTVESRLHRARSDLASKLERAAKRAEEGVA